LLLVVTLSAPIFFHEFLGFLDDPICADVLLSVLPGLLALFFLLVWGFLGEEELVICWYLSEEWRGFFLRRGSLTE
jgi:hypothetical protein